MTEEHTPTGRTLWQDPGDEYYISEQFRADVRQAVESMASRPHDPTLVVSPSVLAELRRADGEPTP